MTCKIADNILTEQAIARIKIRANQDYESATGIMQKGLNPLQDVIFPALSVRGSVNPASVGGAGAGPVPLLKSSNKQNLCPVSG